MTNPPKINFVWLFLGRMDWMIHDCALLRDLLIFDSRHLPSPRQGLPPQTTSMDLGGAYSLPCCSHPKQRLTHLPCPVCYHNIFGGTAGSARCSLRGSNRRLVPCRRQASKARYNFWDQRQCELHVFDRVLFSQTDANAGPGTVRAQPHRGQNMGWFDGSRGTRGTG